MLKKQTDEDLKIKIIKDVQRVNINYLKDFPDGINSSDALIKGKALMRKKIESLFNI